MKSPFQIFKSAYPMFVKDNKIIESKEGEYNFFCNGIAIAEAEYVNEISDLKAENKKLIDKLNIQNQRLNELKTQIEQMKCCENCEFMQDNDCIIEHNCDCKHWDSSNIEDYWELRKTYL